MLISVLGEMTINGNKEKAIKFFDYLHRYIQHVYEEDVSWENSASLSYHFHWFIGDNSLVDVVKRFEKIENIDEKLKEILSSIDSICFSFFERRDNISEFHREYIVDEEDEILDKKCYINLKERFFKISEEKLPYTAKNLVDCGLEFPYCCYDNSIESLKRVESAYWSSDIDSVVNEFPDGLWHELDDYIQSQFEYKEIIFSSVDRFVERIEPIIRYYLDTYKFKKNSGDDVIKLANTVRLLNSEEGFIPFRNEYTVTPMFDLFKEVEKVDDPDVLKDVDDLIWRSDNVAFLQPVCRLIEKKMS